MGQSVPFDEWDDDDDRPRGGPRGGIVLAGVANFVAGLASGVCGIVLMASGEWAISQLEAQLKAAGATTDQLGTIRGIATGAAPAIAVAYLLFGVCALAAGYSVLQRMNWGRGLSLVLGTVAGLLAVFAIVTMNPLGVVFHGAYALIVSLVLNDKDYKFQFE